MVTVIRVLVADDHPFVRAALVDVLTAREDIDVVAECEDGDQVVAASQRTSPDVVLLDLRMERMPGLEAARVLLSVDPGARIVVLTGSPSATTVDEARALGAAGYLVKDLPAEELAEHLRVVAAGGSAWDAAAVRS
jgi:DNA-binding NarL/FixJ family response regulator